VNASRASLKSPAQLAKWQSYVAGINWRPGETKNHQTYIAALRAASLGVGADEAHELIANCIETNGGSYLQESVDRQIERAYDYVGAEGGTAPKKRRSKFEFQLHILQSVAAQASEVNEAWVASRSPIDPATVTPATFLRSIYEPGETVIVFDDCESQGQEAWRHPGPGVDRSDIDRFVSGRANGVWFLVQPVDGRWHPNPRVGGTRSRRSMESVTRWKYAVLECDYEKEHPGVNALWLAAVVQMPLRIVAIYTSGGRSIHVLIRVDADSKEAWDALRNRMRALVVPLGADEGALTAVRLSRLPCCERGAQMQRLLYLNPLANGTPITDQPLRRTGAGVDRTTGEQP
jgi:hypothetical protein